MKLRIAVCAVAAVLACAVLAVVTGFPFAPLDAARSAFGGSEESVSEATAEAQAKMVPQVSAVALHEEGTLVVGIKQDVQLLMSIISDAGTFQGLDIDLASDIAQHLGLKVRFVSVEDAADGFSQGCDIVMDMTDGEEDGVSVVGTYAESALAAFGRNVDGTLTADQMGGKRVAVQMGSEAQSVMSHAEPSVTVAMAINLNDCFHMLEAGEADYVVCSAYQGAFLARYIAKISYGGTIGDIAKIGIGVEASNTELASAITNAEAAVEQDGTYGLIRQKWLDGVPHLDGTTAISGFTFQNASSAQADAA